MKKQLLYAFFALSIFLNACSSTKNAAATTDNGKIDITIVQINDVYEIAPLDGGKAAVWQG